MIKTGMKQSIAMLAITTLAMMFTAHAWAANALKSMQFKNSKINQIKRLPPNSLPQCSIPDPALTNIRVVRVSARGETPGFYRLQIYGEVVNAGRGNYSLSSRPIRVSIRADGAMISGVNDIRFSSGQISAGQRRQFHFVLRHINASTDFIPEYVISIAMGPSSSAFDCRPQNNRRILARTTISKAIAAYLRGTMRITRVRACVRPGRGVIINGQKFGNRSSQHAVSFGNRRGEVLSWTDRQLIVRAPTGLNPNLPMQLAIHATNSPTSPIITRFGVRTCPSRVVSVAASPADFKFGTMVSPADQSSARGVRPLLVVLAANSSGATRPRLAHDAPYYNRQIFGPGYPNVVDYYKVNSYFRTYTGRGGRGFSWRKAAIIGPVITRFPSSFTTVQKLPTIKRLAANNGFDFSRYDRNRDGRVTASELGILIIDNGSTGMGQTVQTKSCTRVPVPRTRKQINVCTGGSYVGHGSSMDNIAHELSHLLGTIDIYGTRCLSNGLSLMSCTGYNYALPNRYPNTTFLLDPWHRSRLGWLKPRIYSVTNAGSILLRAPSEVYAQSYNGGPIILYDPSRGTNEYFILEYREKQSKGRRDRAGYTAYGYDADAPESGIAIWHVKTNRQGSLLQIPDRVPESVWHTCRENRRKNALDGASRLVNRRIPGVGLSCGNVSSAVVISPNGHGILKSGWGGNALWKSSDGEFSLKWLNSTNDADASDVGIRLKVYGEGKGYARVKWIPRQ